MRSIRLIIITISLLTAGLIVLPETVSVFLGKHNWYNLDASPASDVPCQKCHADIYEELNLSDLHIRWGDPAKADTADCEACHRGNASITYANASSGQPGLEAHAASQAKCSYCHFNTSNMYNAVHGNLSKLLNYTAPSCSKCHDIHGPDSYGIAGGFGLSNLVNDTGVNSTHFELIRGTSFDSNVYPEESESCIFCHTNVGVKITFTTYSGYRITAVNSFSATSSSWVISSMTPTNYVTYTEVK